MNIFSPQSGKSFDPQRDKANILRWARIGTWEWSLQSGLGEIDGMFLEKFGYDSEDINPLNLGKWLDMIHPEDQPLAVECFDEVISGNLEKAECTVRFKTKLGNWLWLHVCGGIVERDSQGQAMRITGTLQDVTGIKTTEELLEKRDRLLAVSNEIAQRLLDTNIDEFSHRIRDVLDLLGKAVEVDRVYIWKNRITEDDIYTTQIYEWSLGAEPQQGNELTVEIPLKAAGPMWCETLTSGECINSLVAELPEIERKHLEAQNILSVLVAPVIFHGSFWGFVGFDDCTRYRTWSEPEVAVLKSIAMLIAAAIKRQRTEEDLAIEREALENIFQSSPIGVVITTGGIIRACNARFIELVQHEIGDAVIDLYRIPELRDEFLREVRDKGIAFNRNVQLKGRDGAIRDVLLTIRNLIYEGEQSLLCWIIDISGLKNTERELILARDMAEAATKAKGEFLARMSHEIRTPINAIHGMTYLCMQTELNDRQRGYLETTQKATLNLLGIIDDVLDFSKIESGKLELEHIRFHLPELIAEVLDAFELRIAEKNLKLSLDLGHSIPENLIGDPLRLRQILTNIIDNAVKFTEKGSMEIALKVEKTILKGAEEDVSIAFSIKDTGIGILPEQAENLFASFSQIDGSRTRKYGGTGLGLPIARNLVELMGGTISLESEPGKGSIFRFNIILHKAPEIPRELEDVDFSQRKILVVDDDPVTRELIREYALSLGMRIETAENGIIGLHTLERATFDNDPFEVALIDWKMPRMDGIETIRRIRSSKDIETPPQILMISAYDRSECLRQSRSLGLSGFLIKPITRKSLREALLSAFQIEQADPGKKTGEPETRPDIKGARILLVEDNKINQMVALELLGLLGLVVTVADNGLEAVEAIKNGDFDLVLMDVQMPIMDGFEATREIRKLDKPGVDKLPILAMTANAMDSDYVNSISVGMNDHLTKPIDPDRLRRALENWIVRD